jgi:Trypsin
MDIGFAVTIRIRAVVIAGSVLAAGPCSHPAGLISERAVVSRPADMLMSARKTWVRGMVWARGGAVARTTGRVFFRLDGIDYACSGSVVGGAEPDVVVTAAHCVSDGAGGWAYDWTFVPGYNDGRAPYGTYAARAFYVASPWANGADENDDVAFVTVWPARVGGSLRAVASVVGSQPIRFGHRGSPAAVFGYPAEGAYNGGSLDYCEGPVRPDPYGADDAGIGCSMTEGDSGGPWLSDFRPGTGRGVITGVTSFKYAGANRELYSANLGREAQALYEGAESLPPPARPHLARPHRHLAAPRGSRRRR